MSSSSLTLLGAWLLVLAILAAPAGMLPDPISDPILGPASGACRLPLVSCLLLAVTSAPRSRRDPGQHVASGAISPVALFVPGLAAALALDGASTLASGTPHAAGVLALALVLSRAAERAAASDRGSRRHAAGWLFLVALPAVAVSFSPLAAYGAGVVGWTPLLWTLRTGDLSGLVGALVIAIVLSWLGRFDEGSDL